MGLHARTRLRHPAISHVKLYINEEYRGLYINVEHVDEEFLKKRFKHDHGNLWKCTYPSDLADLGDDPESYKLTPYWNGEQRIYELKTNESQTITLPSGLVPHRWDGKRFRVPVRLGIRV